MKKSVLIAMSGGVDSSAAALILKNENYSCAGITLKLFDDATKMSDADIEDAKKVCKVLDIPHHIIELKEKFKECVMDKFASDYLQGLTPNPCIECNRHIKFTSILPFADENNYDYIATGHYCSKIYDKSSKRYLIKKAIDASKDQSYMLYTLSQDVLKRVLLPLGDITKQQVRELAKDVALTNADKKDSQDICFIKNGDYRSFLEKFLNCQFECGDFLLCDGTTIGQHKGAVGYTTGQRKGLGVSYKHPLYVLSKDMDKNTVTLGEEKQLYTNLVKVKDVNYISVDKLTGDTKALAKLRYKQKESNCIIHPISQTEVILEFDVPQRAVTRGQAAVFYDGEYVIGGGTIV